MMRREASTAEDESWMGAGNASWRREVTSKRHRKRSSGLREDRVDGTIAFSDVASWKAQGLPMRLPLPPAEMRWGGPRYRDDETYIASGVRNARMLQAECGIGPDSRILDIGCGQGRLLNGLLNCFGRIRRYVGIDVHEPSIRWLQENVAPIVPFAEFHHVPVRNERYNPKGLGKSLDLDFPEKFDCITLFSVFTHMRLDDITDYLGFIRSILASDGKVFLTAFVEDDVPLETENPEGYHRKWAGALHCVRLNRQDFELRARCAGLQIKVFRHRDTSEGQSCYVMSVADGHSTARVVV